MSLCNVCGKDLGARAPQHEFLCQEHQSAVPPVLLALYLAAVREIQAWHGEHRAKAGKHAPRPSTPEHLVHKLAARYAACRAILKAR